MLEGSFAHLRSKLRQELLEAPLQVRHSAVTECCRAYTDELKGYCSTRYKRFQRAGGKGPRHRDDDPSDVEWYRSNGQQNLSAKLDEYIRVFNGELWQSRGYIQYCSGCCDDDAHTVHRSEAACLCVPFREVPIHAHRQQFNKFVALP